MLTDDGQQLIQFVTGEDGTIYQVAGKNEQGQTVLIAQGADGEQQCVFLAAEDSDGLLGAEDVGNGLMTVDGQLVQGGELQLDAEQQQQLLNAAGEQIQYAEVEGDGTQPLSITTDDADSQDGQVTAEVISADQPSPGKWKCLDYISHLALNSSLPILQFANSIRIPFFFLAHRRYKTCGITTARWITYGLYGRSGTVQST